MDPLWILAAGLGLAVALVTTPAGVSGAVVLLPAQVGVLGVAASAATPTNLLFNAVALPGALVGRGGRAVDRALTRALVAGSLPGVVVGAGLRATALSGETALRVIIAAVLLPLGAALALAPRGPCRPARRPRGSVVAALGLGAGAVGGAYGVGGGSLVAPALVALGLPASRAAGPALVATLATSLVGIAAFEVAALSGAGAAGPDWAVGTALGVGGLAGGAAGARLRHRLPEAALRRLLGAVLVAVGTAHAVALAA